MTRVRRAIPALALLASALGCGDANAGASRPAAPAPRQITVAVDISGSRNAQELREEREMLDRVIDEARFRDRLILIQMHEHGVRQAAQRWADTMPAALRESNPTAGDEARLANARHAAHAVVPAFFDSTRIGKVPQTDIFATLHTAAEYARDAAGRRPVLVLLSDMLQSADGVEMSRLDGVPNADWIRRRKAAGLVPNLTGVCVLVIGADFSTPLGVKVRKFWMDYFTVAGARLTEANYRRTVTPGASVACD